MLRCETEDGCHTTGTWNEPLCLPKDDCMKLAVDKGYDYYGMWRYRSRRSNPSGVCEREDASICYVFSERYLELKNCGSCAARKWGLSRQYDFIGNCNRTREASYCKGMTRDNFLGDDDYWYVRRVFP